MTNKNFTISSNATEREILEYSFALWNSGYDYKIILLFHALLHNWKADKLIYYVDLIEEKKK